MWLVWQHWIIHAYLIAVYEGFIGRWCIKRGNPCLGFCSSNSTGKVPFMWSNIKQPLRYSNLLVLLIIFYYFAFMLISMALFHMLALHLSNLFFFFFCSFTRLVILVWSQCQHHLICLHILSVDHDWCLLATAFNSFDWVPPKNKRRFSFETLKLSSSYSNDSFSVLKSASPTLTRLILVAGQRGSP